MIRAAFAGTTDNQPPAKTQFSRLVNICGEATCAEEIENYLRYQAGREVKRGGGSSSDDAWRVPFVDAVIKGLAEVLKRNPAALTTGGDGDDSYRVEAWRLYATYMTRAYTYEHATRQPQQSQRRGGRRHG